MTAEEFLQKYRVVDDEGNIDTVALFAMLAYGQQEAEKARQEERERLQEENARLRDLLHEAKLQIEYLHGKFEATGSGNNVLSRIESTLQQEGGEK